MRRVMTLYAVNAWLLLSGAAMALGGAPQASCTTQLGTAAAAAYEAENWSESAKSYGIVTSTGSDARGRQPYRIDSRGLRGTGKLDQCGKHRLVREELQHLQHGARALGTTLGGQRRRQHFFLWRVEGRNHGLLDG